MLYGDKITQKKGIDGMVQWYGNPEKSEKYEQDSIFVNYKSNIINKIYEFLDDKYPALQVSAARTLAYVDVTDSLVINKLEYYANGVNSKEWNLENTSYYMNTTIDFYLKRGKTAYDRKRDAIRELMRNANKGL